MCLKVTIGKSTYISSSGASQEGSRSQHPPAGGAERQVRAIQHQHFTIYYRTQKLWIVGKLTFFGTMYTSVYVKIIHNKFVTLLWHTWHINVPCRSYNTVVQYLLIFISVLMRAKKEEEKNYHSGVVRRAATRDFGFTPFTKNAFSPLLLAFLPLVQAVSPKKQNKKKYEKKNVYCQLKMFN